MASTNRTLLKRLAVDLAALCSDPEDLEHAFDLLNATYATDVAQAARDRLKTDPAFGRWCRSATGGTGRHCRTWWRCRQDPWVMSTACS